MVVTYSYSGTYPGISKFKEPTEFVDCERFYGWIQAVWGVLLYETLRLYHRHLRLLKLFF